MYRILKIIVTEQDPLYGYFVKQAAAANCLRNAALFRMRQALTMVEKPFDSLTDNERQVYDEISGALPLMGDGYKMPEKGKTFLSYKFLRKLFQVTENPDYFCTDISMQSSQQVIKEVVASMKAFYAAIRSYKKDPSAFTGKPKLPGYGKSGGLHTVTVTNQDCKVYGREDGTHELKLPLTRTPLNLGTAPVKGRLKQVTVTPTHGVFSVALYFEDEDVPGGLAPSSRICAIDLGVNNFAAITNNSGLPGLLLKGGILKSCNQYYNKQMAKCMASQTKGSDKKFVPTPETEKLSLRRNCAMDDFMNKAAARIIGWCMENRIDTIIIGSNKLWKQEAALGKVNNQNFVQIPFFKFRKYLEYRAGRAGIRYMEQESYTSKASFLDMDPLPVHGHGDEGVSFSGKRDRRTYRTANGTLLNADLNGSANIGRKAFPGLFSDTGKMVETFCHVDVFRHPDDMPGRKGRGKQATGQKTGSKSKMRRYVKKLKVIPLG